MKKSVIFLMAICLQFAYPANAQVGGLLKKVTKSVKNDLLGKPEESVKNKNADQPEPSCACNTAEVAMDMGGKLQLDYKELSISILDDGRILAKDRNGDDYYIVRNGITEGPYKTGDSKLADFGVVNNDDNSVAGFLLRNKPYITQSGEKFLITFNGKSYGPYGQIKSFAVTKSKEKFAALVVENIPVTEAEGKKMDEAIKNAKSEQEKRDLAMKYTQDMQQKMLQGGGPAAMWPKLVTNVPNATFDPMKTLGTIMNGNIKYDDILMVANDKLLDLKGNTVMTVKPEDARAEILFVNTQNTKYVVGGYGSLTFSDNTTISELFNPHLVKTDGKVFLAYMYYSPKMNAIMQCKIPF